MPKPTKPAASKKPGDLNAADIAELLGVSERTVSNWLRDKGLPCKDDRHGRRFIWPNVLAWYVQMRVEEAEKFGNAGNRALPRVSEPSESPESPAPAPPESFKAALTRKTVAEADLKELELATKRGEVVSIADVQTSMANVSNALRTRILGWPTLMIGRVFGVKDRNALFAILSRAANDLCRELILEGVNADAAQ